MFGAMQGSNREKMYFESAVDLFFFSYVAGFSNILYLGFGLGGQFLPPAYEVKREPAILSQLPQVYITA